MGGGEFCQFLVYSIKIPRKAIFNENTSQKGYLPKFRGS